MIRFTTSAQKTLRLSLEDIIFKLEKNLTADLKIHFEVTKKQNIKKAKLKDGSTLVIAAFIKGKNKTLAMIDHENVPGSLDRTDLQKQWRDKIDEIFQQD